MHGSASLPALHAAQPEDPQGTIGKWTSSAPTSRKRPPALFGQMAPSASETAAARLYEARMTILPHRGRHSCMRLHQEIAPRITWPTSPSRSRAASAATSSPSPAGTWGGSTGSHFMARSTRSGAGSWPGSPLPPPSPNRRAGAAAEPPSSPLVQSPTASLKSPARARAGAALQKEKEEAVPVDFAAQAGEASWDIHGHRLIDLFIACNVCLLRVGHLRKLEKAKGRFPRFQDLPASHPVGLQTFRSTDIVRGEELRRHLSGASDLFVVSHAWLTKEHPDPTGVRLEELVEELQRLEASSSDLVFLDFFSLPQVDSVHPEALLAAKLGRALPPRHEALRTELQERDYQAAVAHMDMIYGSDKSKVIVLPELHDMDELEPHFTRNMLQFKNRGWCCFEFAVARHFGTIVNDVPRRLQTFDPCSLLELASSGKLVFGLSSDMNKALKVYKRTYFARKKQDLIRGIEMGNAEASREGIEQALQALSAQVRSQVLHALGTACCRRFAPAIAPMLEDLDAGVRAEACFALSRIGLASTGQVDAVVARLKDSHHAVRCAACEAVQALGPDAEMHREAIAALLSDPTWTVREAAMLSLAQLKGALPLHVHASPVADSLFADVPSTRVSSLSSLFQMGPSAAVHAERVLYVAKHDTFAFVRDAALLTLRKFGREDLVKEALEVGTQDAAASAGKKQEPPKEAPA
mmetsp:Transcript_50893/g.146187  ORF Transcript_50893/g.146187 Transcript_50893/m.146187 type:complete len:696 (-) Transcript_50893:165-2252(-)